MSYNIDSVKQKKLENFKLPLASLYSKDIDKGWMPNQPIILNSETNEVSISMGCGQEIRGILKDGELLVSKMELSGEGSGSNMYKVLNTAFKESKGYYEAILVWEDGDINKYIVDNGVITDTSVDL